jgi:hypothetical protein
VPPRRDRLAGLTGGANRHGSCRFNATAGARRPNPNQSSGRSRIRTCDFVRVNGAGGAAKSIIAAPCAAEGVDDAAGEAACFAERHNDSSGKVTTVADDAVAAELKTECAPANARLRADDALRLAITLAVEAGEYDRASALLEIAKRSPPSGRG